MLVVFRAFKRSPFKDYSCEIRTLELGRSAEVVAAKVRVPQVSVGQVGFPQICPSELSTLEVSTRQARTKEVGPIKVSVSQICALKVRVREMGSLQRLALKHCITKVEIIKDQILATFVNHPIMLIFDLHVAILILKERLSDSQLRELLTHQQT